MPLEFSRGHYLRRTIKRLESQLVILENKFPELSACEAHELGGESYDLYFSNKKEIKELYEEIKILGEIINSQEIFEKHSTEPIFTDSKEQ